MDKWQTSLNCTVPMSAWRTIWRRASKTSLCVSYKENQFKILMHWYHTPSFLNKLNPTIPNQCWRCGRTPGTQFHLFWECPEIRDYWIMVKNLLYDILGIEFPLCPQLFLLNFSDKLIPKLAMKLVIHILTAARCLIALFWKRGSPPSSLDLWTRIKNVRVMESMTALSNNRADQFYKIWEPWDHYCAEHDS